MLIQFYESMLNMQGEVLKIKCQNFKPKCDSINKNKDVDFEEE